MLNELPRNRFAERAEELTDAENDQRDRQEALPPRTTGGEYDADRLRRHPPDWRRESRSHAEDEVLRGGESRVRACESRRQIASDSHGSGHGGPRQIGPRRAHEP